MRSLGLFSLSFQLLQQLFKVWNSKRVVILKKYLILSLFALPIMAVDCPAEARTMSRWVDISCDQGGCESVKLVSPVFFLHRSSEGDLWTVEADCERGRTRAIYDDGTKARWLAVPPGSVGEAMLEQICR